MKKKQLKESLAALQQKQTERLATINAEGVDTMVLLAESETAETEMNAILAEIQAIETLEERTRQNAARAGANGHQAGTVTERLEDKPFASMGEFFLAVANMHRGRYTDPRVAKLAAGHQEAVDSDGGVLVGKEQSSELWQLTYETGQIMSRCRVFNIGAGFNGVKFPAVDETSRATGSRFGGLQAYWLAEGALKLDSKARFRQVVLELKKLAGLTYATDELLEDAVAFESWIKAAFPEEIQWMVESAIIRGDGVGKPLGILNSSSLVTVAAEGGQTTDTVNAQNIVKMYARLHARSRAKAVWLVGPDVEAAFPLMQINDQPVFIPPGGLSGKQYGMLLGLPVIQSEHVSAIGEVGDIMLVDLSQYALAKKGGVKTDTSIHVRFVYDETAFRFVMRVDGQPVWNSAITPANSANTVSPFVTLAAR